MTLPLAGTAQRSSSSVAPSTSRRSQAGKGKHAPSTPITSDGELSILEGGPLVVCSPPRKRLTRGVFVIDIQILMTYIW